MGADMIRIRRIVLVGLMVFVGLLPGASAQGPRKVALIIANAAYANASVLENPVHDASIVAEALRRAGFTTVTVKPNLGMAETQSVLGDFQQQAEGAAVALIYYAGHGVEVAGVNYLVPVTAKLETESRLRFEAVPIDLAIGAVDGADLRIIVLDACRDNPFARSLRRSVGGSRSVSAGLAAVESDDVLIMFAAAAGRTASDGGDGNSPFAKAFASRVTERGVEVRLMAGRVRDDVLQATQNEQRPFINASLGGTERYIVGAAPAPRAVAGGGGSGVEFEVWKEVRAFASEGNCQVLEDHLRRYPNGDTTHLARAALQTCTPREFQIASRSVIVGAPVAPAPAPPTFGLDALAARDPSRLSSAALEAAARNLGAEPAALRAIARVESALQGFGAEGRLQILFDPTVFSSLTNRRYDTSHPELSSRDLQAAQLGRTQDERWSSLRRAYALDAAAALAATNWGLFQQPGFTYADSGFANIFDFVSKISESEATQLSAYEALIRTRGAADVLKARDWSAFSKLVTGREQATYTALVERAYAEASRELAGDGFLASLVRENSSRLTLEDFNATADRLGAEVAIIRAVVKVESGAAGFGPDGRMMILFEPHLFSRYTQRRFDNTHPNVSYPSWDATRSPRTQSERWNQLAEAYALDPEAALKSASYGLFYVLGINHAKAGFPTARAFVADLSRTEGNQLRAWESVIRSLNLADELQRLDFEGFARLYNGIGNVEGYGRLLREAYEQIKAADEGR